MIVISVVFGVYFARIDPGLLRERLKPPIQKNQPLADKACSATLRTFVQRQLAMHPSVEYPSSDQTPVKPEAAAGGGLKGQALLGFGQRG